jgi:hypothetical protein
MDSILLNKRDARPLALKDTILFGFSRVGRDFLPLDSFEFWGGLFLLK